MQEKLKEILNYYGEKAQTNQLVQELAELMVGITKNDSENIKEEIADVEVMTEQFFMFEGVDIKRYEIIKRRFNYDDINVIEWIERDLKLYIIKALDCILEGDTLILMFYIAQIESLIKRYIKLKEIDRKQIDEIKNYKIDRQLKRINSVG